MEKSCNCNCNCDCNYEIVDTSDNFEEFYKELDFLSSCRNINCRFVEKHKEELWDIYTLSLNPTVTPDFIEKYIDDKWYYPHLSLNKNITPEFIDKHIEKYWDFNMLSSNPNISEEFVRKHITKNWDWEALARCHNFSTKFYEEFFDKFNNKIYLIRNSKVSIDFLMNYSNNSLMIAHPDFGYEHYKILKEYFSENRFADSTRSYFYDNTFCKKVRKV